MSPVVSVSVSSAYVCAPTGLARITGAIRKARDRSASSNASAVRIAFWMDERLENEGN